MTQLTITVTLEDEPRADRLPVMLWNVRAGTEELLKDMGHKPTKIMVEVA